MEQISGLNSQEQATRSGGHDHSADILNMLQDNHIQQ